MSTFVPAIPLILAAAINGFIPDCDLICVPETIYMPEVPMPVTSPGWPQPHSKDGWVPKSHHVSLFKSGGLE